MQKQKKAKVAKNPVVILDTNDKPTTGSWFACFTLNNWTQLQYVKILNFKFKYLVVGKEVGENGTPHLQCYIEFKRYQNWCDVVGWIPQIHWEPRGLYSTSLLASNYCKKGEQTHAEWHELHELGPNFGLNADFFEEGELSKDKRFKENALEDTIKDIQSGKLKNVMTLAVTEPHLYQKYNKTLHVAESVTQQQLFTRKKLKIKTKGYYYYGSSYIGKTFEAYLMTKENHYEWNLEDKGWQDNYFQEDDIVIEEFRGGGFSYDYLLKLVNWTNFSIARRNKPPIPMISKRVIITSPMAPWEVFHRRHSKDKIAQFFNRFEVYTRDSLYNEAGEINEWIRITPADMDRIVESEKHVKDDAYYENYYKNDDL